MSRRNLTVKAAAAAALAVGVLALAPGVANAEGYSKAVCQDGYRLATYYQSVGDPWTAANVFENLQAYGCQ